MKLLELLEDGKRILNIDETWLSGTNFKRAKWREHGQTNSDPIKIVNPRISVIAAVDTEGDVYMSLTQVNTDVPVMHSTFQGWRCSWTRIAQGGEQTLCFYLMELPITYAMKSNNI